MKWFFLWFVFLPPTLLPYASALSGIASEQEILDAAYPKLKLQFVPQKFTFDSPQHQYRTQRSVRADFNGDNTPDIAICAVKDLGKNHFDGYLVVASFRNGEWRPAFTQKFLLASGPSIKWDSKKKQLFFFLSFKKSDPLELLWDSRRNTFYLADVDATMKL